MKKYLLICCMLVSASATAQVYKCTVNGKTVYADSPCGAQATVVQIQRAPAPMTADERAEKAGWAELRNQMERRSNVRSAVNSGEPAISMSEADLYHAMGRPTRTNTGNYNGTIQNQLIYDRHDRTWYVYLTNGIVTSIQNTERIGRKKKECLSSTELRKLEVSASSITVQGTARGEALRKEINEAKDCQ